MAKGRKGQSLEASSQMLGPEGLETSSSTDILIVCLLFFHIFCGTLNVDNIKLKCITFHVSFHSPKKIVDIARSKLAVDFP